MRQSVDVDSRRLAVESWGPLKGCPVFLLHGTPGSANGPRAYSTFLRRHNIRLIAYDRPGYGGSDRLAGRDVAHAAADIAAIGDRLGLEHFAVVGRSGGGPHALACAALLSDRVTRAAALASPAPWNAVGLDWFEGMTTSNITTYRMAVAANEGPGGNCRETLEQQAYAKAQKPESLIPDLSTEMPDVDRHFVSDAGVRRMLRRNFKGAVSQDEQGSRTMPGWMDDVLSFCKPWGFDLESIARPVLLWQGARDVFSPVGHYRWLADHIRGVEGVLEPGLAHFHTIEVLPHVLLWLVDGERTWLESTAARGMAERWDT